VSGAIVEYDWDCGAGAVAPQTQSGPTSSFTCTYNVGAAASTPVSYTITLTVKDNGFGDAGHTCQKSSAQATATVAVGPQ
jgi:hypothetical protein